MKVVVQRTAQAKVSVENEITGEIEKGLLLLVCLEVGDTEETYKKAAEKISALRIFECPDTEKMNKTVLEDGGDILAISQFTLSWNGRRGNRPSFDGSMEPREAQVKFKLFCEHLRSLGHKVETGRFGKHMNVELINNGPVTFSLSF